jgi:hypothetical protein
VLFQVNYKSGKTVYLQLVDALTLVRLGNRVPVDAQFFPEWTDPQQQPAIRSDRADGVGVGYSHPLAS